MNENHDQFDIKVPVINNGIFNAISIVGITIPIQMNHEPKIVSKNNEE